MLNRQAEASTQTGHAPSGHAEHKIDAHPTMATRGPVVAAVVVTWNRRETMAKALECLAAQEGDCSSLHVVVVDNASEDGTVDYLRERFAPELVVDNHARVAHEPDFHPRAESAGPNALGFGSLTIVGNQDNFGGCGGFNTGFHYVAGRVADGLAVDYIWLVDDDAEVAPDAMKALTSVAAEDPTIGIVGSRTVDINDRRTTIESTIYFDFNRGRMGNLPTENHRLRESHDAWVEAIGGTKGRREFQGVRDVDVVSACSLLARWSAVAEVGFWDERYFIYCDDADWCLRMGRAGYRVVCNLDAVVYHTPWNLKLTPARLYYAQRNLLWTMQKLLPTWRLRYATFRWMLFLTRRSITAALARRRQQARVFRQTIDDVIDERPGKIELESPEFIDEMAALEQAGAVGANRTILGVCSSRVGLKRVTGLRVRLRDALAAEGRAADEPRWIECVANSVSGAYAPPDPPGVERLVYSSRWPARLKRQLALIRIRPDAVIVTDNASSYPIWRGDTTIHLDRDKPGLAHVDRDTLAGRLGHAASCVLNLVRVCWFCLTMRPSSR